MSVRHHMNYLSPYARGIVHGLLYGVLLTLASGVATWLSMKF